MKSFSQRNCIGHNHFGWYIKAPEDMMKYLHIDGVWRVWNIWRINPDRVSDQSSTVYFKTREAARTTLRDFVLSHIQELRDGSLNSASL